MFTKAVLGLSLLATLTTSLPLIPPTTCYSGLYLIGARGSEEDPGYGSVASVINGVLAAIPNSRATALDYPASVLDPLYDDSVSDGITAMITLIGTYVNDCGGKIALVGFIQGGNVVTDVLAGGVDKPAPISSSYASHNGQSFDAGTDTSSDGIFARSTGGSSLALLNTYASKARSYCDTGDVYCASGDDTAAHRMEVPTWSSDGINFIVGLST